MGACPERVGRWACVGGEEDGRGGLREKSCKSRREGEGEREKERERGIEEEEKTDNNRRRREVNRRTGRIIEIRSRTKTNEE